MKSRFFYLFILSLISLYSCENQKKATIKTATTPIPQPENQQKPNFGYKIELPVGWGMFDTTMQGITYRIILAPDSLDYEKPRGNIVIASMEGREIDDFTTRNINFLKTNMPGAVLLKRDSINISSINARWFTYTREQNGVVRDMINYIIPFQGFAYIITCGTNQGTMEKYRLIFDQIARSFRG